MIFQVTFLRTGIVAASVITGKWLLPCMFAHMYRKVVFARGGIVAAGEITDKWPFSGVHAEVLCQLRLENTSMVTSLPRAFEPLLAHVLHPLSAYNPARCQEIERGAERRFVVS